MNSYYDVIVIGGGHAGIEAASAAARIGCSTCLITMTISAIGRLSCNPAIGGMAKGQIVREIDALGGEMGRLADLSGIHFKMLGKSKGPAMWSPRSQNDKDLYPHFAQQRLQEISNLTLIEGVVGDVGVKNGAVSSVQLQDGQRIECKSLVVCSGTFLSSRLHVGEQSSVGGRMGEPSAESLSEILRHYGISTGRLKTGTPPRIHKDSIDWKSCTPDVGDAHPVPFSRQTTAVTNQIQCYLTTTTKDTHQILESGFDRSPMFTGRITGAGPRYCPSIEDKVYRFSDKDEHQIFLEPEGLATDSVYVNGFSTSLPEEIQEAALRTIPSLEKAQILRYGYAVEYDYFPSYQLQHSLESKVVKGLFFAGQVNGTSGYEEAAAQGLLAGMNAARAVQDKSLIVLDRSQAYIGVLIDDLVSLTISEPYRMFTSRAEYRLLLRQDNADIRLAHIGYEAGLVDRKIAQEAQSLTELIEIAQDLLKKHRVKEQDSSGQAVSLWQLLKRPECSAQTILPYVPTDSPLAELLTNERLVEQIEISARYDGYIQRQLQEVERFKGIEESQLPATINYNAIVGLSSEGREKLIRISPRSLGQASRISGVSRSDITILSMYVR